MARQYEDGNESHEDDEEDEPYPCFDTWEMAAKKKRTNANGCFSSTCHGFHGLEEHHQRHLCGTSAVGCNRIGKDEASSTALRADEKINSFTIREGTQFGSQKVSGDNVT